jgi:hypothetical protein
MGGHVALRMTSLLPPPLGRGTRNNAKKRSYIENNLPVIEYRTIACDSRESAVRVEDRLRTEKNGYEFPT